MTRRQMRPVYGEAHRASRENEHRHLAAATGKSCRRLASAMRETMIVALIVERARPSHARHAIIIRASALSRGEKR